MADLGDALPGKVKVPDGGHLDARLVWRTASGNNASCVEVAPDGGRVLVRDSKRADGPVLTFTAAEWVTFLDGAKTGVFDVI